MKKYLIVFLTILFQPFQISSGNIVTYAYDNVGNRVAREIILSKNVQSDGQVKPEVYSEMLSERDIKISPNPTSGNLKIEISGYDTTVDEGELSIYSMSGQLIQTVCPDAPVTDLDITSQPVGVYILTITLNGENTSWKIIKK